MLKRVLSFCLPLMVALLTAAPTLAVPGIVNVKGYGKTYVDVEKGKEGAPVFVLVNGLIYELERWDTLVKNLHAQGHTVIRYALPGQPENLRLLKRGEDPAFFKTGMDLDYMTQHLAGVLKALGLKQKVNLVGLSYGSSVAAEYARQYPETIEHTIMMAPLVVPLDQYDPNGAYIRMWLGSVRFWENYPCDMWGLFNPYLCMTRDYWYNTFYDYVYSNYLGYRVQKTPPGVDPETFKKSVFHLVRAARDFNLHEYTNVLPEVHMMVASEDQRPLLKDQLRFWENMNPKEKRSMVVFMGAAHALPDESPVRAAQWLGRIALKEADLQKGKQYKVPTERPVRPTGTTRR